MIFKLYKCQEYNFVFPCSESFLFREHFIHHLEQHLVMRRTFSPLQRWCIHSNLDIPVNSEDWVQYYIKSCNDNSYNINCENCFPPLSISSDVKMKKFFLSILRYLWRDLVLYNSSSPVMLMNEVKDISWEMVKGIIRTSRGDEDLFLE